MLRVLNLLLLVWLLVATPAWSLTTLYVDTDAVSPSPPTYSSLADAVAALPATLDDAYVIECSGSAADTAAVTISVTADATNTLTIKQAASDRHNGVWSDSKYRIDTGTAADQLTVDTQYVTIDGLQIWHADATADQKSCIKTPYSGGRGSNITVKNCFLRGNHVDNWYDFGIYVDGIQGSNNIIYNNIIYQCGATSANYGAIRCNASNSTVPIRIDSNTFVQCSYAIWQEDGDITARNNLVVDHWASTTDDFAGTFNANSDHNASTDTSAPGAHSLNNTVATDLMTDPANGDYTLKPGSPAIGAGADLSAYFTADITGATRTVPWDIGAYKYATAVATPWHYYNGSTWIDATAYRYDGSAWQPIATKHYTGSAWE